MFGNIDLTTTIHGWQSPGPLGPSEPYMYMYMSCSMGVEPGSDPHFARGVLDFSLRQSCISK